MNSLKKQLNEKFWFRMFLITVLGFSSGIPLALTGATLQAWMATLGIDLKVIGLFALVGLPLSFKFVWAPVFDRYSFLPFHKFGFGRRSSWVFLFQILLIISIFFMGRQDPSQHPILLAVTAIFVSFFSASQDIVIDAFRREYLPVTEFGLSFGFYSTGYRVAMLVSGALALILADQLPWSQVYQLLSFTFVIGMLAVLLIDESRLGKEEIPRTLGAAVVEPFLDFFKRKGAIEILFFLLIFKLDHIFTVALTTPFLMQAGYSKTEIGAVSKGVGLVATIFGSFFGGGILMKIGMRRALIFFGFTQALSALSYYWLSLTPYNVTAMAAAVSVENFFFGITMATSGAFMMSLCNVKYSATQYALLSSFMALSRYIAIAPSGYIVEACGGWPNYFLFCAVMGIPGLMMLARYNTWKITLEN